MPRPTARILDRIAALPHLHARHRAAVAYGLLILGPVFFAANMLVARLTAEFFPPMALTFWRWVVALLLMLPFTAAELWRGRAEIRAEAADLLGLGGLAIVVCGAFVYIGAATTTATNIGLIYAASPVLIVVFARLVLGEAMSLRQGAGVLTCLLGVVAIITRGDPAILTELRFTVGDLWILAGCIGWAVYATMIRARPSRLRPGVRFAAICAAGLLALIPLLAWEVAQGRVPPLDARTVAAVLVTAIFPSVLAFQLYAHLQLVLGAARTSLIMYLIPLYNAGLAVAILGETLEPFHLVGAALVLPGIFLATYRGRRA